MGPERGRVQGGSEAESQQSWPAGLRVLDQGASAARNAFQLQTRGDKGRPDELPVPIPRSNNLTSSLSSRQRIICSEIFLDAFLNDKDSFKTKQSGKILTIIP